MKAIKKNLKDQILTNDDHILYCPECNSEWSGNSGDYFNVPDDYVFICNACKCELKLVRKKVTIKYIR